MRRFCPLLVLLLLAVPVQAQEPARTVSRTFDLAAEGTVAVDTYKGRIDVTGWARDRVSVEVRISGEKQEWVDATEVAFDASSDRLEVETTYDDVGGGGLEIFGVPLFDSQKNRPRTEYTLKVPRRAALSVDTYSADTRVETVEGDLMFDAYSASLEAGALRSLTANTYSGDLSAHRVEGRLTVDTYSGDVRVDTLAGSLAFDSYSGDADIGGAALRDDSFIDTYSGDLTLTLEARVGAVVETSRENLEAEMPLSLESIGDERVRGTIGEGGPALRFDSYSGTLTLGLRE
jgi:hypothetical protein